MTRNPTASMVRLRHGEAPGLMAFRTDAQGRTLYRWVCSPSLRARAAAVHGFATRLLIGPDGAPLGLEAAIAEAKALTAALKTPQAAACLTGADGRPLPPARARETYLRLMAAAAEGAPAPAPRLRVRDRTLTAALDHFIAEARAGRVKKRDKATGRLTAALSPATVRGYDIALNPLRKVAGHLAAARLTRADILLICETMIEDGCHTAAVHTAVATGRALGWLNDQADWRAHVPDAAIARGLGLGTPGGRLRMATPEEAGAVFQALHDPAALAAELGLHGDDAPPARPAAAAFWLMALWTAQRGNDTVAFTEAATADGRLRWIQSKTGKPVDIPLLDAAQRARRLALAARAGAPAQGANLRGDYLFINADTWLPYRQQEAETKYVYYKYLGDHFRAARALAARKIPSLLGGARDPFGRPVPRLVLADTRDTAVTRLFEAMSSRDGALAAIAAWHGSDMETLLKLLKHYLVLNPRFADQAGEALRRHAEAMGYRV